MITSGTSVSIVFKVSTRACVEVPLARLRKPASSITGPSATGSEKGTPTSIADTPKSSKKWIVSASPSKPFSWSPAMI